MTRAGFDNERYLAEQTAAIRERVEACGDKLYLEFGGKLMFDFHAARVLPGFDPNVKLRLLQQLGDDAEVLVCIYAGDIERRKVRADFGITYDADALRLIDDLRRWNIPVSAVVITRYDEQPAARVFKNKLERQGFRVYTHGFTAGYPTDVDTIVSGRGYGANTFIPTTKRLVVVTAPGPGSGKLATCLSQLYHEHLAGRTVGYAKFETFPIWNLPLKHPVNIAYESATADLRDFNLVDPFHLEAYGQTAVNYNRDVEIFPVLRRILERILGKAPYRSPTDMGVNRAGFGIVDDEAVREAAKQEAIRRYYRSACEYLMGFVNTDTVQRTELLMEEMGVGARDRAVVQPAADAAKRARDTGKGNEGVYCGAAIQLADGAIVTGTNSPLMHAASSLVLNAVKQLAGIPDAIHLLSPSTIAAVAHLKQDVLATRSISLDLEETLIALTVGAATNPTAQLALEQLKGLSGCEVHMTHVPTHGDEAGLRKLGVNLTTEPVMPSRDLLDG
ncbi:MAG: DUF1846 domain-containing protein [Rhodospirillaceae bacterium]